MLIFRAVVAKLLEVKSSSHLGQKRSFLFGVCSSVVGSLKSPIWSQQQQSVSGSAKMFPEGWQETPAMAIGLVEDIFLPFKTPLSGKGDFTIDVVLEHAKRQKFRIGLWVDLTNTNKYYKGTLVEQKGVRYFKLPVVGRQSPSNREVEAFVMVCSRFLAENPTQVIGIHCTHGFNRTGYLICSYLSLVKKLDPHLALAKFAASRPPGIYRQNMVDDFVRHFGGNGQPPPRVKNPPWKVGNTFAKKMSSNKAGPQVTIRKESVMSAEQAGNWRQQKIVNTVRVDIRVPQPHESFQTYLARYSVRVPQQLQQAILSQINALLGDSASPSESIGPGHEYLKESSFEKIKSSSHMVAWLPQECFRYYLYLDTKGNAFLIDEYNSIVELPKLKLTSCKEGTKSNHHTTLIEGIVVRKSVFVSSVTSEYEYHFEMCDLFALNGVLFKHKGLSFRLKCLREEILEARKRRRKPQDLPNDPFRIRIQPIWNLSQFWKLQRFDWFHSYPVGPVGLIFFPSDPLKANESKALKWVCPSTDSAFFRLKKEVIVTEFDSIPESKFVLCLDDRAGHVDELTSDSDDLYNTLDPLVGSIVECRFLKETSKWEFKREAQRRSCSDSSELVECIRSGLVTSTVATKPLFAYLGSLKNKPAATGAASKKSRRQPELSSNVLTSSSARAKKPLLETASVTNSQDNHLVVEDRHS